MSIPPCSVIWELKPKSSPPFLWDRLSEVFIDDRGSHLRVYTSAFGKYPDGRDLFRTLQQYILGNHAHFDELQLINIDTVSGLHYALQLLDTVGYLDTCNPQLLPLGICVVLHHWTKLVDKFLMHPAAKDNITHLHLHTPPDPRSPLAQQSLESLSKGLRGSGGVCPKTPKPQNPKTPSIELA